MEEWASGHQVIATDRSYENESHTHSPLPHDALQASRTLNRPISLSSKEQQQLMNIQSVRIFLACCVGTILQARGIRPEATKVEAKEKRYLLFRKADDLLIAHEKGVTGYEYFCTAVSSHPPSDSSFLVIYRNSHDAAMTRITDYLDIGVLDALKKGVLNAIRFSVSLNGQTEVHVTESYVVHVIRVNDTIDLNRAACSLENSMMSLIYALRRLDPIPVHNVLYFGVNVFLAQDCPSDYHPVGFSAAAESHRFFPNTSEDWIYCKEFDCGNFTAQVSLKQTNDTASQIQRDFETKAVLRGMQRSSSGAGSHMHPTMSEPICREAQEVQTPATTAVRGLDGDVSPGELLNPNTCVGASQERGLCNYRLVGREHVPIISIPSTRSKIRCECRNNVSPGGVTITCSVCGLKQHAACYGYCANEIQNNLPEHVCYQCLLLPKDEKLNKWMSCLVKSRLALQYLYNHQTRPTTQQQIAAAMRYSFSASSNCKAQGEHFHMVLSRLVKEKWISITNGTIRLSDAASYRKAWESYLSPRAKICRL